MLDEKEIRRLVSAVPHWHHRFHIAAGVETPGSYDPTFILERLGLPEELSGLRALDVGPSDGFFSMHLARRGASVTAVDYRAKDAHGFGTMERITGLSFDYHQMNVYDISRDDLGGFDIVLFLGVLYHLPDMVRALDIMRHVCDDMFFLETEYEPNLAPGITATRYYEADSLANDFTNFWAPNRECVAAMMRDTGFTPGKESSWGRRLLVQGKADRAYRTKKMRIAYGVL